MWKQEKLLNSLVGSVPLSSNWDGFLLSFWSHYLLAWLTTFAEETNAFTILGVFYVMQICPTTILLYVLFFLFNNMVQKMKKRY